MGFPWKKSSFFQYILRQLSTLSTHVRYTKTWREYFTTANFAIPMGKSHIHTLSRYHSQHRSKVSCALSSLYLEVITDAKIGYAWKLHGSSLCRSCQRVFGIFFILEKISFGFANLSNYEQGHVALTAIPFILQLEQCWCRWLQQNNDFWPFSLSL